MRTVTFSDASVAKFVGENFVAAWFNRAPGFRNNDDCAERKIFRETPDAYATKNICTFFLSPAGEVVHYFAGYCSPSLFLENARLALAAWRASKEGGVEAVRKVHAERAKGEFAARDETLSYKGTTHEHSDGCERAHRWAERYYRALHQHWAKVKELPSLEKVRFDYLYGSQFTEECEGATGIAGRSLTGG